MKNKVILRVITIVFALCCLSPILSAKSMAVKANELKPIDMYLIAGQSNAAGYSPVDNSVQTEVFENVMYAGMTEKVLTGAGNSNGYQSNYLETFEDYRPSVKAGYGAVNGKAGPEYGIAKVINGNYSIDNKAIIFKTAAGGTSLLDTTNELSKKFGNWYPRSLWAEGYDPDISGWSANNDATGLLYKLFVENFKKVYNELVNNGYAPVVKGMAWMQGCTDLYESQSTYESVLKVFIKDIREDLVEITGDTTLNSMPFVIGEIATSFSVNPNYQAISMNERQRAVADAMGDSVATIPTADLLITVDSKGTPNTGCPDSYHFNFKDCVTLGTRFGEKLLELSGKTLISKSSENGSIDYVINQDGSITFTVSADKNYKFSSLKVNGVDVSLDMVNGVYTLTNPSARISAVAEFVLKDKVSITYQDLGKQGGYRFETSSVFEGDLLSIKVYPAEGYRLDKVTFNGEEMAYNAENNSYEIMVNENGEVGATFTKLTSDKPTETPKQEDKGCGSLIGVNCCLSVLIFASVILVFKNLKKDYE